jgi:ankyrin repeat protein
VFPHSLEYIALRAITTEDFEQLAEVLKHPNFDINKPIDKKYNITALQYAAMKNKFPFIELLLMHGANINQPDA